MIDHNKHNILANNPATGEGVGRGSVIGHIIKYTPDLLEGYVLDSCSDQQLYVSITINEKYIGRFVADQYVAMLDKKGLKPYHGFRIDLKGIVLLHPKDHLQVRTDDGLLLPLSPQIELNRIKSGLFNQRANAPIFFMHIPKCGGTSLRHMLYNVFDQEQIWPNLQHIRENKGKYPDAAKLRQMDASELANIQCYMGHLSLWNIRFMSDRPRVITFLRRPADYVYSLARHKQRHNPDLRNETLEAVMKNFVLSDSMCRMLLPPRPPGVQVTQADMEIVFRNIDMIEFVGILERYDQCLDMLEERFGWCLGDRQLLNKTPEVATNSFELNDTINGLIQERITYDTQLYDYIVKKWGYD